MLGIMFMLCSDVVCLGAENQKNASRILSLNVGGPAREVVETPPFTEIEGLHNVKISVRFRPDAGFDDVLLFSVINGGTITSATLDGKTIPDNLIGYIVNSANLRLSKDMLQRPSSKAKQHKWHKLELNVRNASNSSCLKLAGASADSSNHGFFVDSIEVNDMGEVQRSTLRVLYWNIQNGMWTDQPNGYKNFIAWVKNMILTYVYGVRRLPYIKIIQDRKLLQRKNIFLPDGRSLPESMVTPILLSAVIVTTIHR